VFGRQWYKEVIIVILLDFIISIPTYLFVPFPINLALVISLVFVVLIIWRVRKKKLTIKEALTLVSIYYATGITIHVFIPDPLSVVFALFLIFVAIWLIHKKTTATVDDFP
jgi:uncharacterized membrane protein YfcA